MRKFALGVAFLVVFAAGARAEAPMMKEGQWTMNVVTKIEGMPEVDKAMKELEKMPPEALAMVNQMSEKMGVKINGTSDGIATTVTQCLNKAKPIPDPKSAENCQETHETNGNTVKFHMTCKSRQIQMESDGWVTYNDDTMEGLYKSHQVANGTPSDMTVKMSGKYIGPCP